MPLPGEDARDDPPLYLAVQSGSVDAVRHLLEQGADVNTSARHGATVFAWLAESTTDNRDAVREIARLLIEYGANANVLANGLHRFVRNADAEMVRFLVENGAVVTAGEYRFLLSVAASKGSIPLVELLLQHGATSEMLTEANPSGRTILQEAAASGSLALVRFLIEQGASIRVLSQNNETPLHGVDSAEIIGYLAAQGVPVDARTARGDTALLKLMDGMAYYGFKTSDFTSRGLLAVNALLAAGANPLSGNRNRSPLLLAVAGNQVELVRAMAANLAGVSLAGISEPLLEAAAENDAADCIRLLLPFGVQPGGPFPARKKTPLHVAAGKNAVNLLRLCLEAGADPNAEDKDGNTPLHIAAAKDRPDACRLLLQFHANPTRTNNDGKTPRQVAQDKNKRRVLAVL